MEKRIPLWKIINSYRKVAKEEEMNKGTIRQTESNLDGNNNALPINNYFKCKGVKFSYQYTYNG